MPYRSRLDDLKTVVLHIAEDHSDADMREDLATILAEIENIEENDKSIYNIAYRAAYRAATIWHLGGLCQECGEHKMTELEIDHIDGYGVKSDEGRGPEDWKDLSVLRVLCKKCHAKTENYKINKRYQ